MTCIGFAAMWIDKRKAIKHRWRISERALLIIAAMALVYLVLGRISQGLTRDFRRTLIFCLATAATVVLCAVARLFHLYLMPVILAALLLTSLDSIRAGLTANTLMTLLMTLLAMQSMENDSLGVMRILLTGLLSGLLGSSKSGSRKKNEELNGASLIASLLELM